MSRDVPFHAEVKCEGCGVVGAYDFMGDLLCTKCAGLDDGENDSPAREKEKSE